MPPRMSALFRQVGDLPEEMFPQDMKGSQVDPVVDCLFQKVYSIYPDSLKPPRRGKSCVQAHIQDWVDSRRQFRQLRMVERIAGFASHGSFPGPDLDLPIWVRDWDHFAVRLSKGSLLSNAEFVNRISRTRDKDLQWVSRRAPVEGQIELGPLISAEDYGYGDWVTLQCKLAADHSRGGPVSGGSSCPYPVGSEVHRVWRSQTDGDLSEEELKELGESYVYECEDEGCTHGTWDTTAEQPLLGWATTPADMCSFCPRSFSITGNKVGPLGGSVPLFPTDNVCDPKRVSLPHRPQPASRNVRPWSKKSWPREDQWCNPFNLKMLGLAARECHCKGCPQDAEPLPVFGEFKISLRKPFADLESSNDLLIRERFFRINELLRPEYIASDVVGCLPCLARSQVASFIHEWSLQLLSQAVQCEEAAQFTQFRVAMEAFVDKRSSSYDKVKCEAEDFQLGKWWIPESTDRRTSLDTIAPGSLPERFVSDPLSRVEPPCGRPGCRFSAAKDLGRCLDPRDFPVGTFWAPLLLRDSMKDLAPFATDCIIQDEKDVPVPGWGSQPVRPGSSGSPSYPYHATCSLKCDRLLKQLLALVHFKSARNIDAYVPPDLQGRFCQDFMEILLWIRRGDVGPVRGSELPLLSQGVFPFIRLPLRIQKGLFTEHSRRLNKSVMNSEIGPSGLTKWRTSPENSLAFRDSQAQRLRESSKRWTLPSGRYVMETVSHEFSPDEESQIFIVRDEAQRQSHFVYGVPGQPEAQVDFPFYGLSTFVFGYRGGRIDVVMLRGMESQSVLSAFIPVPEPDFLHRVFKAMALEVAIDRFGFDDRDLPTLSAFRTGVCLEIPRPKWGSGRGSGLAWSREDIPSDLAQNPYVLSRVLRGLQPDGTFGELDDPSHYWMSSLVNVGFEGKPIPSPYLVALSSLSLRLGDAPRILPDGSREDESSYSSRVQQGRPWFLWNDGSHQRPPAQRHIDMQTEPMWYGELFYSWGWDRFISTAYGKVDPRMIALDLSKKDPHPMY